MQIVSSIIVETELAELYRKERLEPGCDDPTTSIAISLRRIADQLDGLPRRNAEVMQFGMIYKIKDRFKLTFEEAIKIATAYFNRVSE
jgi:hypothetical protein